MINRILKIESSIPSEFRGQVTCLFLLWALFLPVGCRQPIIYNDPMPEHDAWTVDSSATGETRNVNVWLPPGYSEGDARYPVLYMPDGGTKEDFPHIANTLAALVERKTIAPVILVGVENTDRKRDLTGESDRKEDQELVPDHGGSDNFRTFFRDELRPEIQERYRCNGQTAIIGESLAGLFVAETFAVEPTLFDRYIAFDASLWWNDGHVVELAQSAVADNVYSQRHFWFASSSAGGMEQRMGQLSDILRLNAVEGLNWKYVHCPQEQHSTIFRAWKERAIIWTLWENEAVADEMGLASMQRI